MSKEKDIVVQFITAGANLQPDVIDSLVAENCECWFTGGGKVSRDDFVNGARFLLSSAIEPGPVIINDIIQEGNKLAVEYENILPMKNGRTYHNHYQSKFVVEDGKITVIHEYLDSAHVAEVFGGNAPLSEEVR